MKRGDGGAHVRFNLGKAPHAKYVIEGTRVMTGRNVIDETMNEPEVEKKMKKAIIGAIRKRGPRGQFARMDFKWTFK